MREYIASKCSKIIITIFDANSRWKFLKCRSYTVNSRLKNQKNLIFSNLAQVKKKILPKPNDFGLAKFEFFGYWTEIRIFKVAKFQEHIS